MPAETREDAPVGAMFAQRESDGVDWYEYVHPGTNFSPWNVVIAAVWREDVGGYVVGPAVHDAAMIFPQGHIVVEIDNYHGADPQKDLGNKVYNLETETFSEQPPPTLPPDPLMAKLDTIMARLDKLEQK
jgi:hypothetical protein